jgi:Ca-activated chloride channel family protein
VNRFALLSLSVALSMVPSAQAPLPVAAATVVPIAQDKAIAIRPDMPACGMYTAEKGQRLPLTLKHTKVDARISGDVSRVEVQQTFQNPFKRPLEAVYVFPLPEEAAVDAMEIRIGKRVIKANIKKREEAKQIYEDAKNQGKTAALLEQERDNVFTQSVANIKPGEAIHVTIRYTAALKFESGDYEFVFPMVVGPRYIPQDGRVPDPGRVTPPTLKPGVRSGQDIAVNVSIESATPVTNVRSYSHRILTEPKAGALSVRLQPTDTLPNKDLIVRYRASGDRTRAGVLTQKDTRGGHFALHLTPAVTYGANEVVPRDIVFLIDTSGSQMGDAIEKSKVLMTRFIQGLNPKDTFNIVDFASATSRLSDRPLANTQANREKALAYVKALDADGGTELMNGIREILSLPAAADGRLRSFVLMTDGLIGDDRQVLAEVERSLKKGQRLYTFGVGSGTNRFLVERLAEIGRGTCKVVGPEEPDEQVAATFFRQINQPVLRDISVAWEGAGPAPLTYPAKPRDLFAGQPLVVYGRKSDAAAGTIKVSGYTADNRLYAESFKVAFGPGGNPAIAQLWGRNRLKAISAKLIGEPNQADVKAATDTALSYNLLSDYTAFVAVSEEQRVDQHGKTIRVEVPVEMPQGMTMGADKKEMSRSVSGMAPPPSRVYTQAPHPKPLVDSEEKLGNAPTPVLALVSVQGLEPKGRASLEQRLKALAVPAGQPAELALALTVVRGKVTQVKVTKQTGAADAATVKAIVDGLKAWQAPVWVDGQVQLVLEVRG